MSRVTSAENRMNTTIGQRIKHVREAMGLTQADLAQLIQARGATVSDWERDVQQPLADSLTALVGALGISGHWLLTGEGAVEYVEPGKAERDCQKLLAVLGHEVVERLLRPPDDPPKKQMKRVR